MIIHAADGRPVRLIADPNADAILKVRLHYGNLIKLQDAATILGVKPLRMHQYLHDRRFTRVKLAGRNFIPVEEIKHALEAGTPPIGSAA